MQLTGAQAVAEFVACQIVRSDADARNGALERGERGRHRQRWSLRKQGVRVNVVAFGAIQTPMVDRFVGEAKTNNAQRDWLASVHPVGRIGTANEAAQAVVALLENPFITGSILALDEGWTAQ